VWPVSVAERVDTTLISLQHQWERLSALANSAARRAQASSAMAQRGALEQDLALMHYEPSWVHPGPQWIAERRGVLAKLSALEGPIFLFAERRPGDAAIGVWLRRIMGNPPQQPAETSAITALQPLADTNAAIGDTRAALLHLGDARRAERRGEGLHDPCSGLILHSHWRPWSWRVWPAAPRRP